MNEPVQLPAGTDVLIIGTGAVGLTLAASLASAGVPAVLADKQAEPPRTDPALVGAPCGIRIPIYGSTASCHRHRNRGMP